MVPFFYKMCKNFGYNEYMFDTMDIHVDAAFHVFFVCGVNRYAR